VAASKKRRHDERGVLYFRAMKIRNRNPIGIIILSIITFGIYALYWIVKTKGEINSLGGKIPTALLAIIPIANVYFFYKYAEAFSTYVKKDNATIMWFLLFLVIAPVAMILVQITLNEYATAGEKKAVAATA
jgi:hypothetical protein